MVRTLSGSLVKLYPYHVRTNVLRIGTAERTNGTRIRTRQAGTGNTLPANGAKHVIRFRTIDTGVRSTRKLLYVRSAVHLLRSRL